MSQSLFKIEGMTCDRCVHAVQEALSSVPGVRRAKVSLEKKQADVIYEGILDIPAVLKAVEQAGYKATPFS